jgi:hypothetical protein
MRDAVLVPAQREADLCQPDERLGLAVSVLRLGGRAERRLMVGECDAVLADSGAGHAECVERLRG